MEQPGASAGNLLFRGHTQHREVTAGGVTEHRGNESRVDPDIGIDGQKPRRQASCLLAAQLKLMCLPVSAVRNRTRLDQRDPGIDPGKLADDRRRAIERATVDDYDSGNVAPLGD
jgi:hypothetical protein